jgi:hypothetical protein
MTFFEPRFFLLKTYFINSLLFSMRLLSNESTGGSIPARSKFGPLALALIIQGGLLGLAVFVVVLVPEFREDPEFVTKKKIYLPQKELEHKVALAAFQNAASSPMQIERISTAALLPDALPCCLICHRVRLIRLSKTLQPYSRMPCLGSRVFWVPCRV